jgi:AcrR family transcriptional regulator
LPAKTAYHHGNLKPALIAAALKEIAHHGMEAFSLRRVARRAKVSAPAVYRHFADKDALIAAIAVEAATRLNDLVAECIRSAPPNPLEQFRAGGIAVVRFAAAHSEHFRVMSVPGMLAKAPPEFLAGETSYLEGKRRMIRAAQAAGLMADLPVEQILLAANSLVIGLAHQVIEGRFGKVDDKRATELANLATQVFGVGILPRDEDQPDPTVGMVVKGKKSRR